MTLKDLSKAYSDKEWSNVPEHCRPPKKFSDSSANELTKAIIAYLEKIKEWKAWRQSSDGRFIPGKTMTNIMGHSVQVEKGKFIPRSKASKGCGDITCMIPPFGRRLDIEVKHGKDRQSEDQKKFQKELEAMGGLYIIVKTWDDFYFQICKIEERQIDNLKFTIDQVKKR